MQIPDPSLKVTVQCTQSAFLPGFLCSSSDFVARFMLLSIFVWKSSSARLSISMYGVTQYTLLREDPVLSKNLLG